MDARTFQGLFKAHPEKLSQAFIKLSEEDWKSIDGNLEGFLKRAMEVYKIPREVLIKELEAVQKNVEEGIEADYVPYLDPME